MQDADLAALRSASWRSRIAWASSLACSTSFSFVCTAIWEVRLSSNAFRTDSGIETRLMTNVNSGHSSGRAIVYPTPQK